MKLLELFVSYYDVFEGKYDFLRDIYTANSISEPDLISANNQFLSDLINTHAKSCLISKYISLNTSRFDQNISSAFGNSEVVKEIIKVGSNLSDYFGYCGFSTDSKNPLDGFSFVIDSEKLAFSHNDIRSFSDLIGKIIRFRKVVYVSSKFDPAYQLPTYSVLGVSFYIVPGKNQNHLTCDF